MRLLLHICCAPCALMPLADLRADGVEVMGLWFNPNIHPYTENQRRLETLKAWAQTQELRLIVQDEYDLEPWLRACAWRESQRCRHCYFQRLERAAQVARRGGFDAFGSTLLFSKRQKHQLAVETGRAVGAQRGIAFLERDWRPLWAQGQEQARQLDLYRQAYCGCIYSERDRYLGAPRDPDAGTEKRKLNGA